MPKQAGEPVRITVQQPHEIRESKGMTRVWLAQTTGEVLHVRDPNNLPWAERVIEWAYPLHNGEKMGLLGRILVACLGAMPLLFFISGLKMRKYRKNK